MDKSILYLIVGILVWAIIGYLIAKIYFWINLNKERKKTVNKSRSVILWEVNEKLAPIMPDFPYDFKDITFIGKGIDYIVFNWLNKWKLEDIVFLEIKTNKSSLNKNEKSIKETVDWKKVKYEILRL